MLRSNERTSILGAVKPPPSIEEEAMQEMLAFTADHVASLTGLSSRQLRYWDRTGFFAPTLLDEHRRRTFGRIYSFRDVVGLRTIALLRNLHRVPLQELRKVGEWLHQHHVTPWASLQFALVGKKVVFFDPAGGVFTEPRADGQTFLPIALEPIASEMLEAADQLRSRRPEQLGQLSRNRYVVRNAWVIAGTRIPTSAVWSFHQAGFDTASILREYPSLTAADVLAAIKAEAKRRRVA
jgi:DNA-binding transcriptional MerR regulator